MLLTGGIRHACAPWSMIQGEGYLTPVNKHPATHVHIDLVHVEYNASYLNTVTVQSKGQVSFSGDIPIRTNINSL